MTDRQKMALAHPIDPTDTEVLIQFARTISLHERKFGTILTIDRVNRELWWHSSVSVLGPYFRPFRVLDLDEDNFAAAYQLARELLKGVGRPDSDERIDEGMTIQIRRRLTIEEERTVHQRSKVGIPQL